MLRTILFGSALLACLVAGRVTAHWPNLAAAPAPVVAPATAAAPVAPTPQVYFTASRSIALPGHPAASTGL